jgi:hypothetical protein
MDGHIMRFNSNCYRGLTFTGLLAAIFVLGACSSSPKIFSNEDPNANFSQYSTYGFSKKLGTDSKSEVRSIDSSFFIQAVSNEMEARGYKKSDNPDLTVNFYMHTKEKIKSTQSPTMSGSYYGYRGYGGYGAYGGYQTTVTQYTEGTVNIDLIAINPETNQQQLAWEGIAVGKVTDKVHDNFAEVVAVVVGDIMAKYPYTAPGFVPPTTKK